MSVHTALTHQPVVSWLETPGCPTVAVSPAFCNAMSGFVRCSINDIGVQCRSGRRIGDEGRTPIDSSTGVIYGKRAIALHHADPAAPRGADGRRICWNGPTRRFVKP